jgi:hypothetical protein
MDAMAAVTSAIGWGRQRTHRVMVYLSDVAGIEEFLLLVLALILVLPQPR